MTKMKVSSAFVLFLVSEFFVVVGAVINNDTSSLESSKASCPCKNPIWCELIPDTQRREVFAFSLINNASHWNKYDWKKLTTVVMVGFANDDLMCLAHSTFTKVSYIGNVNFDFRNATLRKQWIQKQVEFMQLHHLDGINFDYESEIKASDNETRNAYTSLVSETSVALSSIMPYTQVTVDIAWNPNTDQRYYDYVGLAKASDFLFVMAYDEQSQIFGECVAMPNSGLLKTTEGLLAYISKGIPRYQLVLGLPWYGYIYPCQALVNNTCQLKPVPFRIAKCSDAAGRQYDYSYIRKLAANNTVHWNQTASTPYFSYMNSTSKINYQVQYDNPKSLKSKYILAIQMRMRGVGMWNIDSLDYSDTSDGAACRTEMFKAIPQYKPPPPSFVVVKR